MSWLKLILPTLQRKVVAAAGDQAPVLAVSDLEPAENRSPARLVGKKSGG